MYAERDHVNMDWKMQEELRDLWHRVTKVCRVVAGGNMVKINLEEWVKSLDLILLYESYCPFSPIFNNTLKEF